jgi:single-stranded-DNA-specific exonuclease
MKYKLIGNTTSQKENFNNNYNNLIDKILLNRGISDPTHYLNTTNKDLYSYELLDNIDKAIKCLLSHIENNDNIYILIDSDVDGVCSAAMLYQYLKEVFPQIKLSYILQDGKQHGLNEKTNIPDNTQLLLTPDASTNDFKQCKILKDKVIDVIALDHHIKNVDNPYAIIVNPYCSKGYPNFDLSGGAVTYKFLQALDAELWNDKADNYLDLVALSLISDSMNLQILENKRLVELGLSQIKNKAFISLINKQSFSISGIVNIINISFYITPLINATIRSGEMEDKKNLFEAFCQIDQEFDYTKNSKTETVKEDIYTRIARVATNLKAKQNREIDKGLEIINEDIKKYNRNDNKILMANASGLDNNYIGLVAMKLCNLYSKPCILLHESEKSNNYFTGSMRNYNNSPIENFKQFIEETKLFDFAQGHKNACGIGVKKNNIKKAIELMNEKLKDVDFEKVYKVDFVLEPEEVSINFVQELDRLKGIWCGTIEEPCILVKSVRANTNDIELMGKEQNTWKFKLNEDGIGCIKFKCNKNDLILKLKENEPLGTWIELEIVVKVNMNSFNQILSPQAVVQDYNLIKKG